jgi:hypothetical protein
LTRRDIGMASKKKGDSKKKGGSKKKGAEARPVSPPAAGPLPPQPVEPSTLSRAPGGRRSSARLSPDQLSELLQILPTSDSVELKVTVPESSHRSTVAALGMDPLNAQIRQVFFYDTPDLDLYKAGVVVRARRIQGKGGDSVVKLRPVVPEALPPELRNSPAFVAEVDAMPGGYVCSGTLKSRVDPDLVRQVALGGVSVRKLFSKEQRALFAEHAPENLDLDQLPVLGPIFVLKLAFTPAELQRRMVAEMWLYPDGSRILELSTKCLPPELLTVFAEARRFLDDRGIDRSGDQQAKTRRALTFFSKELTRGKESGAEADTAV